MARNSSRHTGSEQELMEMSQEEMEAIANAETFQNAKTYEQRKKISLANKVAWTEARRKKLSEESKQVYTNPNIGDKL